MIQLITQGVDGKKPVLSQILPMGLSAFTYHVINVSWTNWTSELATLFQGRMHISSHCTILLSLIEATELDRPAGTLG